MSAIARRHAELAADRAARTERAVVAIALAAARWLDPAPTSMARSLEVARAMVQRLVSNDDEDDVTPIDAARDALEHRRRERATYGWPGDVLAGDADATACAVAMAAAWEGFES